jgi:hypothetical protein
VETYQNHRLQNRQAYIYSNSRVPKINWMGANDFILSWKREIEWTSATFWGDTFHESQSFWAGTDSISPIRFDVLPSWSPMNMFVFAPVACHSYLPSPLKDGIHQTPRSSTSARQSQHSFLEWNIWGYVICERLAIHKDGTILPIAFPLSSSLMAFFRVFRHFEWKYQCEAELRATSRYLACNGKHNELCRVQGHAIRFGSD